METGGEGVGGVRKQETNAVETGVCLCSVRNEVPGCDACVSMAFSSRSPLRSLLPLFFVYVTVTCHSPDPRYV